MKKIALIVSILLTVNFLSAQWIQQEVNYYPVNPGLFKEICFADQDHGWVTGQGTYATTNGGLEWNDCEDLWWVEGSSVFFLDPNNGWITGSENGNTKIWHTNTGGIGVDSWEVQLTLAQTSELSDLFFLDSLYGWFTRTVAGVGFIEYQIYRTNDGGTNWNYASGNFGGVSEIEFVDSLNGWAGESPILHSVDGGETWVSQNTNAAYISSICFHDTIHGWITAGGFIQPSGPYSGFVLHTNDGGNSWTQQLPDTINHKLNDIAFIDDMNGWVVGDSGIIIHTSDGGNTWEYQESGTNVGLMSVCFVDTYNGWICGDSGLILHTDNGGTVGVVDNLNNTSKLEVFPNPSKSRVTITYKLAQKGNIILSILNSSGQEIKQLALGKKDKGQIDLNCSNFSSGIYFINLQTDKGILTEKLIIE